MPNIFQYYTNLEDVKKIVGKCEAIRLQSEEPGCDNVR